MPSSFDWMHPSAAQAVVGVITDIAQQAVEDAVTYRMATVTNMYNDHIDIEFADEPGNTVSITSAGTIQPTFITQNIEIEVRNGTEFVISRVFGAASVDGVEQAPQEPPAAVTGLSLTTAERGVVAHWDPLQGATSYLVERAKDSAFTVGVTDQIVTSNQQVSANLIAGEEWFYRVHGNNSEGDGPWSDTVSIIVRTDTPAPGIPGQVQPITLTTIPKQITASWPPLDGVDNYELQWDTDPLFGAFETVDVDGNTFTVGDLEVGMTYNFRVRGVNSEGEGDWSNTANIPVMMPGEYTDGLAPEDSPDVTVRVGIKMLTAEWAPGVNDSPLTYEVHIGEVTNFAPSAATKLGETSSTFWITDHLPNGDPLDAATLYYMRVIAKDADGAAPPGAQGSGTPIDLSQDVYYDAILGDGLVPGTPAAPAISSGIGYLYASWPRPSSPDPLQYEVHVSSAGANFVPDANTLSLVTGSLFGFIRKQGPGAGSVPLVYGVTYWVKIIAVDVDGVSAPSIAASGFTVQANTADIVAGAITSAKIYSGAVMADRIQASNIAANAITANEIYAGAVEANKIQAANITTGVIAVGSALIQTGAIGTAMIGLAQITDAKIDTVKASKITTDVMSATITVSGIIRTAPTGNRIEITPGGLYAYNSAVPGGVSFSIDASGNAFFYGNIQATGGSFSGNITSSATITGGTISGATIQTASSGQRVRMSGALVAGLEFLNSSNTVTNSISVNSSDLMVNSNGWVKLFTTQLWIADYGLITSPYVYSGSGAYDQGYRVYSPVNPPSYPVTSVNGMTGAVNVVASVNGYTGYVNLNYNDVGAASSGHGHFSVTQADYLTDNLGSGAHVGLAYDGSTFRVTNAGNTGIRSALPQGITAKNFVIDHPNKKSKYLVHAVVEGLTADVVYRGVCRTKGGEVWIDLPDYFEALTEVEGRTVQLTQEYNDEDWAAFLQASYPKDGKFMVYAFGGSIDLPKCTWPQLYGEECPHGCENGEVTVHWEVKAARKDPGSKFEVEPSKKDYNVSGDGPYTYLVPA